MKTETIFLSCMPSIIPSTLPTPSYNGYVDKSMIWT